MASKQTDNYPRSIIRKCLPDIIAFSLLVVITIAAFVASYIGLNEENNWFPRSGVIVVSLAALLEYRHLRIFKKSHIHNSVLSGSLTGWPSVTFIVRFRDLIGRSSIALIISGTLIWGFGDIIFNGVQT